ncbi:predicted protein [Lichtheimia corymbifera JMRC:FSU:9682]|uniref:Uncharacterized protein n=1 Tax=Lichtheimia corymbifera JMRC:FSU:9682 TaxID=1263082 RepID=A0A068SBC8_9FUNG|nr:predicted protein [Lichtheimia corymbifera JMRC:FSU:9682]
MNQFISEMGRSLVFQRNRLCESNDTGQQVVDGIALFKTRRWLDGWIACFSKGWTARYTHKGSGATWFCEWQDSGLSIVQIYHWQYILERRLSFMHV